MILTTILACGTAPVKIEKKEKQVEYKIFTSSQNGPESAPIFTVTYKKAPTEWVKKLK